MEMAASKIPCSPCQRVDSRCAEPLAQRLKGLHHSIVSEAWKPVLTLAFIKANNPSLPSILPSKTDRFAYCGRCTRFAQRLLFHINRQLSSGAESLFQADLTPCSPFTKYHDHPYHYVKPRHLQVREKHDAGGLVTTVLLVHVGFPNSVRLRRYRQVRDVPLCERRVSGVR